MKAFEVAALSKSRLYCAFQKAFRNATGLPLELQAPGAGIVHPPADIRNSPFCTLTAGGIGACAACYGLQTQLGESAQLEPMTLKCFTGVYETAVPVRVGKKLVAFLRTGHVLLDHRNRVRFNRIARELIRRGVHIDLKQSEEAYFATRVLSTQQYRSIIHLLTVFAEHLAASDGRLAVQQSTNEPPVVRRARELIESHCQDEISLGEIASLVNVNATYFSELFSKATGVRFVEYVARVRVGKAMDMLRNPKSRITEVAFGAGFQSLSQFNRSFKRFTGKAPTEFRRCSEPAKQNMLDSLSQANSPKFRPLIFNQKNGISKP